MFRPGEFFSLLLQLFLLSSGHEMSLLHFRPLRHKKSQPSFTLRDFPAKSCLNFSSPPSLSPLPASSCSPSRRGRHFRVVLPRSLWRFDFNLQFDMFHSISSVAIKEEEEDRRRLRENATPPRAITAMPRTSGQRASHASLIFWIWITSGVVFKTISTN